MSPWRTSEKRLLSRLLAAACLLLFFSLALSAAVAKSPTNDEPAHFLRAAALSQNGDLQFQMGHAPLSHRLMGLFLAGEPSLPALETLPSWPEGERLQLAAELMWGSGLNVERSTFLVRLPLIWLALLLGALVGNWALVWHGRGASALALALFAAEPNLIASAALATTDLTTAATYFGTVYGWWRYRRNLELRWWFFTAVLLGLALATKMTAVLLLPVLFLLTFLFWGRGQKWWRPFAAFAALIPVAALVLWFVYGFQVDQFAGFRLPAAAYLVSWQNVLAHVERGHRAFFLGQLSGDGWLAYFPVTFLIKTPVVILVLALIGLGVIAWRRSLWPTAVFLLLPIGALFAAAMTSRLNIGYRHILPVIPFVLLVAGTAVLLLRRWRATQLLLALAVGWYIFSGLRQQPDFLAYFNELVGGTPQGYRYLGDSNLDWGQDLSLLAQTVAAEGGSWIVSYAGAADPAYYGLGRDQVVNFEAGVLPFALANPAPGRYAVSVDHLHGVLEDADLFDWFRRQTPQRNLGGSILIYDVAAQADGAWVAFCLDPAALISQEEAAALLGRDDLRSTAFDCRQSWVVPGGGAPGWYVLPQADRWWIDASEGDPGGATMKLVYRHRATADAPSYDIFYWPGGDGRSLSAGFEQEALAEDGRSLTLPYPPSPHAELQGYFVDEATWITAWTALDTPTEPLSIQAHLYGRAQTPPLVADGLGYASEQWQAGDFFLQRHAFAGDASTATYMQSGLYNYQTLEVNGELLRLPEP